MGLSNQNKKFHSRLITLVVVVFCTFFSKSLAVSSRSISSSELREDSIGRQFYKNWRQDIIPFYLRDAFLSGQLRYQAESGELFINVTSQLCIEHADYFFNHIEWEDDVEQRETWALQMIDAWGKFPDGIFSGHTQSPGDFFQCLQVRQEYDNDELTEHTLIKGSYCSSYVVPNQNMLNTSSSRRFLPSQSSRQSVSPEELIELMIDTNGVFMYPFLGSCLPSSCDKADSQAILNNIFRNLTGGEDFVPNIVECYTDEKPPFDAGDITMIVLLSTIGLLCVLGTLVDVTCYNKSSKGTGIKAIVAFSVYTNTKKFLNTKANADNLGCLHGLRFLSMAWVVLCHSWAVMVKFQFTWNLVDMKRLYATNWTITAVMNGTVSVDTFFVMSGALVAYNVLKILDKTKGKINIPLMYFHRYCRLTPTYAIITGIMATLLTYLGSAPSWFLLDAESKNCEKNWWHNILYINNLVTYGPTNGICYGESWYLSNDMQFYILSPLIIWPLWKWKGIGLAMLGILSCLSIAAPTIVTAVKDLPPTLIPFIPAKTYMNDLYIRPWIRIGPYLVGIFLGYILHSMNKPDTKPKQRIPRPIVWLAWLLSTAVGMTIVFSAHPFFDPANFEETTTGVWGTVYSGVHRYVWGVMIAWIIFACVHGYGGVVNDFLSWSAFIPLGRLTFCVYITSYHLQMLFHLNAPTAMHYNTYTTINYFFAHMVMSLLVGYALTITLESPFMQLEKLIFQRERPPRPNQKEVNTPLAPVTGNNPSAPSVAVTVAVSVDVGDGSNNTQTTDFKTKE